MYLLKASLTLHAARCAQVLAAFLKAIGCIIPLMDAMYASYYTREVMLVLVREFQTPDEEMKKIVLKVGAALSNLRASCCAHARPPACCPTASLSSAPS